MKRNLKGLWMVFAWTLAAAPVAADDLALVNVFPNPVRVYEGHTAVIWDNMPADTTLRVYTSTGKLVREDRTGSAGTYLWSIVNESIEPLASGIYVYVITTPSGQEKTGKIAIIQ